MDTIIHTERDKESKFNEPKFIDFLERKLSFLEFSRSYREPGYEQEHPDRPILLSDWNRLGPATMDFIESNYDVEWSDEWCACDKCGGIFRTRPSSYGWIGSYCILNGCAFCSDCVKNDPELLACYLNSLTDNPHKIDTLGLDLESMGYRDMSDPEYGESYESGLHIGMDDDPVKILERMKGKFPDMEFVFGDPCNSQFSMKFNIFGRKAS